MADQHPTREVAIGELAKVLHWKMEHLDPSDNPTWESLDEGQRDFYRLCVEAIIAERLWASAALQ